MKINKSLISCLLFAGCLTASAQETTVCQAEQGEKTVEVFNPHWYIQVQPLGAQYTLGETKFKDLVSYNAQLGVGYNFNSVMGLRFSINAFQSRAGWEMNDKTKKWNWNYVSPSLDATVNLSNLFCGYNAKRLVNVSLLGGVGANVAWNNKEAATVKGELATMYKYTENTVNQNLSTIWDGTKVRLTGRVGAAIDFRLSDVVSVGAELQANMLNDNYNSKGADNADWYFNGLVGVKFNLGKSHKSKTVSCPVKVVERIVEKVVEVPVEKVVEKTVVDTVSIEKKEETTIRRDIFFAIGKTSVSEQEAEKISEIAKFMKANPDSKLTITGYADKGTGSAELNARLSALRAQSIVNSLVNEYGISSTRISSESKGETVQPFTNPVLNRVSICIAK